MKSKIDPKLSKFWKPTIFNYTTGIFGYFIPKARLAFTKLKQIFTKASILYYFEANYYIYIKIDISGYAIKKIFD